MHKIKPIQMKQIVCILFYTFFFHASLFCQNGPGEDYEIQIKRGEFSKRQVIPPPAEAASLGKYGNIPVSLFTGTPQISIPIYSVKGSSIALPVSLSYYAGGFKPEEIAAWTGASWNLNAGGVITRSVMGNPDNQANYFGQPEEAPPTDMFLLEDFKNDLKHGVKERQRDIYFYNFGGYSGKFMIRQNKQIITKEKDNFKFDVCIDCPTSYVHIIDNNGTTYEFREVENATMEIRDFEGSNGPIVYNYPVSWYLSRVISADMQEEIILDYYTTSGFHKQFSNANMNKIDYYEQVNTPGGGSYLVYTNTSQGLPPLIKTYRKYLKSMTFKRSGISQLVADFISITDQRQDLDDADYPGERLLTSIVFTALNEHNVFTEIKKVNLGYNYFTNSTTPANKRLRLDQVSEVASASSITTQPKPPYLFEYNSGDNIPPYETEMIDHWGFCNLGSTGGFREPTFQGSLMTVISKIKYPTGGYTMFEYEANECINAQNQLVNVGGVRVKKITDYSFDNQKAQVKNYEYVQDDGNTSGKAYFPVYDGGYSYTHFDYDPPYTVETGTTNKFTKSYSSVIGLGSIGGSHIGYTTVAEYLSDHYTNRPLGKTVYEYGFNGFGPTDTDNDIYNGSLLKTTVYENSGKLLQQTENVYVSDVLETWSGMGVQADPNSNNKILCKTQNGTYEWKLIQVPIPTCIAVKTYPQAKLQSTSYSFRKQFVRLTEQTVKVYDQLTNSYLTNNKKFTYGNNAHTLPTVIEQTTTDTKQVVTVKKYAQDYNLSTTTPGIEALGIQTLIDKNIVGAEVETYQYRQNADGSNKQYLGGSITNYDASQPYPIASSRVETVVPLTSFIPSAITAGGSFIKDANYKPAGILKYTNGQLTEQRKNNDIPVAYIWGYDNNFPVAEINNADDNTVAYTSFEGAGTGNWRITTPGNINLFYAGNTADPGITGTRYFQLTNCSANKDYLITGNQYIISYWNKTTAYTVSGAIQASYRQGKTIRGWIYHEHLVTATAATITLTGSGLIDELRFYPAKAQMQTYTYQPFVGMSSSCSVNNTITYYEYDGYNRLIFIRDEELNIIKNHQYNYNLGTAVPAGTQTLFYNNELVQNFTKTNCSAGIGASVAYKVAYGKYASVISEADANAKAQADATANGQAYANANGQCYWLNIQKQGTFVKNNCPPEQGGGLPVSGITYTVAAGTYTSFISQADADAKAQNDVNNNGQNNANSLGTCSCPYPARKIINGICERGIKVYSSSVWNGSSWTCTYYYRFSDDSIVGTFTETSPTYCVF
jgi:hypothetical protein